VAAELVERAPQYDALRRHALTAGAQALGQLAIEVVGDGAHAAILADVRASL
jgi:hypothetical protein